VTFFERLLVVEIRENITKLFPNRNLIGRKLERITGKIELLQKWELNGWNESQKIIRQVEGN
jgi:hypothetical protein